jgi:hypothetical protein
MTENSSDYSLDVWKNVIADMERRRELGIESYGQPVEVGRFDSKQYLYEELLDAAVYLKASILGGPSLDEYQSSVPPSDSRTQLLVVVQKISSESGDLQQNLALALSCIAAIARFNHVKMSDLSCSDNESKDMVSEG